MRVQHSGGIPFTPHPALLQTCGPVGDVCNTGGRSFGLFQQSGLWVHQAWPCEVGGTSPCTPSRGLGCEHLEEADCPTLPPLVSPTKLGVGRKGKESGKRMPPIQPSRSTVNAPPGPPQAFLTRYQKQVSFIHSWRRSTPQRA